MLALSIDFSYFNFSSYGNSFRSAYATFDTFEFLEEAPKMETKKVVKTKIFDLDPISVEDAADFMDAVGHDFYVFLNGETGEVNVLYRRNDGNLGLIEVRK